MKIIEKKILPQYFDEVICGRKSFEFRKDEDNIKPGDSLVLKEWDGKQYTGNEIITQVTYVLRDAEEYGLPTGYCIIGIVSLTNQVYNKALKDYMTECFNEIEKRFMFENSNSNSKELAKIIVTEIYNRLISSYRFERKEH